MNERRYTACGGVVVRGGKVLVLLRPGRGEVRLPKGHIEPGESPEQAALREVLEEAGYSGLEVLADLGEQLVEFDHEGAHVVRAERYFLLSPRDPEAPPASEGEAQFRPLWLTPEEAIQRLSYEPEREWVRRAAAAVRL